MCKMTGIASPGQVNVGAIETMLHYGSNVNAVDRFLNTPLHCIEGFHESLILLLIEWGADIFTRNDVGNTLLHTACQNSQYELAKFYIDKGLDIGSTNLSLDTPLHLQTSCSLHPDEACTLMLIRNGANIYMRNAQNHLSSLSPTCDMIDVFQRLWDGTFLMRAMLDNETDIFRRLLHEDSIDVNEDIGDGHGWTVLHAAVYLNRVEIVNILVKCSRINLMSKSDPQGITALHVAAGKKNIELVKVLSKEMSRVH